MTELSYEDDILEVGERVFKLKHPIDEALVAENLVAVLLSPPTDSPDFERNVIGLEFDGHRRWTIDSTRASTTYTYIKYEDGSLYAHNWNGWRYGVDTETGSTRRDKRREKGR